MKRALLVGVNNYQDPQIQDLNGCVNDVLNMRSVLKELYGFEDEGIHVLTDARATADNIISRLTEMIRRSVIGDLVVFHFSGHGSQIRDRSGDELSDSLDELICPSDMNWDDSHSYIIDDELAKILDDLPPGVKMEVFLDCCHSGTGIRALPNMLVLAPQNQSRYTPPPIDILCRSMDAKELPIERLFLSNQFLSNPILWSGCKSEQTSADAWIEGQYHGAFTYHFCKAIRSGGPGQQRGSLIQKLRNSLAGAKFDQIPQLETKHQGKLSTGLFE